MPNDSVFCQKCGTKLINDGAIQQPQEFTERTVYKPTEPIHRHETRAPRSANANNSRRKNRKRKNNKLLIGLVGVVVIAVTVTVILLLTRGYSGDYPDEVLFNDRPITRFLGMTRDDVIAEFGEPESYSDGRDRYFDKGFIDLVYSNQSGKIIYISFVSNFCTINGRSLGGYPSDREMDRFASYSPLPYMERFHIQNDKNPHKTIYDPLVFEDYYYITFDSNNSFSIDFMFDTSHNQGDWLRYVILFSNEWGQSSAPVIETPDTHIETPQLQDPEVDQQTDQPTNQPNPSDSILRLDGTSLDDVWQFDPESTSYILGEPLHSGDVRGSFEMEYRGFTLSFDAGELRRISINDSSLLSIGGVTLNMNQAGLLAVFGEPSYDYGSVAGESYDMVYEMGYFVIQFIMTSPENAPSEIFIWLV